MHLRQGDSNQLCLYIYVYIWTQNSGAMPSHPRHPAVLSLPIVQILQFKQIKVHVSQDIIYYNLSGGGWEGGREGTHQPSLIHSLPLQESRKYDDRSNEEKHRQRFEII